MAGQSSNLNVTAQSNGTTAGPIVLLHYAANNAMAMAFPMFAGVHGAVLGAVNRAAALPPPAMASINSPAAAHFLVTPVLLQVIGYDVMAVGLLVFRFVLPPHGNDDDDVHQVAAETEQHGVMLLDDMLAPYQTQQGGELHQVDDEEVHGVDAAVEEAPEGRPWYMEEDMSSILDDFGIHRTGTFIDAAATSTGKVCGPSNREGMAVITLPEN